MKKPRHLDENGLGHVLLSLQQGVTALAQKSGTVMLLCGVYDDQTETWKAYKYDENGEPTSIVIPLHRVLGTGGKPATTTPLIATTINGKVIAIPMICGTGNGNGGTDDGNGDGDGGEEGSVHFPGLWWLLHR